MSSWRRVFPAAAAMVLLAASGCASDSPERSAAPPEPEPTRTQPAGDPDLCTAAGDVVALLDDGDLFGSDQHRSLAAWHDLGERYAVVVDEVDTEPGHRALRLLTEIIALGDEAAQIEPDSADPADQERLSDIGLRMGSRLADFSANLEEHPPIGLGESAQAPLEACGISV